MPKIPWEETEQYIRSGHRSPEDFEQDSFRIITLSEDEGVKAVIGKLKGEDKTTVQSYLFDKSKGWTLDKAKDWFEAHRENVVTERFTAVLPFTVLEKLADKPLRIRGVAVKVGVSRNRNVYTPKELEAFAPKLVDAPVYVEHVAVPNAVGKVVNAWWDPQSQSVWYEAEVYDGEVAEKIRKGLIRHVSVGADYERIDVLDGKVPQGLHNAELSLVAVPGIPEANIQVLESYGAEVLNAKEKAEAKMDDVKTKVEAETDGAGTVKESLVQKPKEPVLPVSEVIRILEGLLLSPAVERSTLGEQLHHQQIRRAIWRLRERLTNG